MKYIIVATIGTLLLASCQSKPVEQAPSVHNSTEVQPITPKTASVKEEKKVCLKSGVDTICDVKTGQRAEVHYLSQSQFDSLLQKTDSYTLVPDTLFNREPPYWDLPEESDTTQFNLRLDSVMALHPVFAEVWHKQLEKVVLNEQEFCNRNYYRPGCTRDIITEVYHYGQTGEYLLNMWTEHTAFGFWLNEKSTGDSLLLMTSHCAYNGTYVAGLRLADCDYCADIHIYSRNKESLAVEECLNYIDHDLVVDSLCWVGPTELLCKGCYRTNTETAVFILLQLL